MASTASPAKETDIPEPASDLIRALRHQLRMTQEEFAHALEVTVSTVNRWENAHSEPSKLAWRAVRDLARSRGLTGTTVERASTVVGG